MQRKADQVQLSKTKKTVQMRLGPASTVYRNRTVWCESRHCGRSSSQTVQRGYLPSFSVGSNLHWISLHREDGGDVTWRFSLSCWCGSKQSPKGIEIVCYSKPHELLAVRQTCPLLPLPTSPHRMLRWRSKPLLIPSSFLGDCYKAQTVQSWYLKVPKEGIFFLKTKLRRHKKAELFVIAAQLLGKASCRSGCSMSMVQDLPHPAISIYIASLPDMLKSGPPSFLTWLTHFFVKISPQVKWYLYWMSTGLGYLWPDMSRVPETVQLCKISRQDNFCFFCLFFVFFP